MATLDSKKMDKAVKDLIQNIRTGKIKLPPADFYDNLSKRSGRWYDQEYEAIFTPKKKELTPEERYDRAMKGI